MLQEGMLWKADAPIVKLTSLILLSEAMPQYIPQQKQ